MTTMTQQRWFELTGKCEWLTELIKSTQILAKELIPAMDGTDRLFDSMVAAVWASYELAREHPMIKNEWVDEQESEFMSMLEREFDR